MSKQKSKPRKAPATEASAAMSSASAAPADASAATSMDAPMGFSDAPMVPADSVVEVNTKGEAEVVATPPASPTAPAVEMDLATMAARIAALEAENKDLKDRPIPAPQAVDTRPKNKTSTLVQTTLKGNIRTTMDPSQQFVDEQVSSGPAGV